MNAFWKLYKKDIRFLTGPGIVLILVLNLGGLLNAINYISPTFYTKNLLYLFRPISLLPSGIIVYMYAALFLYAVIHIHLKTSKYQDFILPCRRSKQLLTLFAAVATWVTAIPVAALLLDVMYGVAHSLLPSLPRLSGVYPEFLYHTPPGILTSPSYRIGHIISLQSWLIMLGLILCMLIMVGYIITIIMQRLPKFSMFTAVFTGIATVILELMFAGIYLQEFLSSTMPDPIHFMNFYLTILILISVLLVPALILYERYAEV